MRRFGLFLLPILLLASAASAERVAAKASVGDALHGEKLLKKNRSGAVKVDGNWFNGFDEPQALKALAQGADGFPKVRTSNPLDHYDVLAYFLSQNTDLAALIPEADHALIAKPELDEFAVQRLKEQAGLTASEGDSRRIFALFQVAPEEEKRLRRVPIRDSKRRDTLKPTMKVGYVVFMPLEGLGDAPLEAAIAVSNDMVIRAITIRNADGSLPKALNQAARRYVGRGARGQYKDLRATGAGKAVRQLAKPLSKAYLLGAEHIYMYEVDEREYFAFDE